MNADAVSAETICPYCGADLIEGDKFCAVCGYERGSGVVKGQQRKSKPVLKLTVGDCVFELTEGEYVIGRSEGDLVIPNPYLSRKHAKLRVAGGRVYAQDIGSTNGTFLDGVRLATGDERQITETSVLKFAELTASLKWLVDAFESEPAGETKPVPEPATEKPSPEEAVPEPSPEPMETSASREVDLVEVLSPWELVIGGETKPLPFGQIRVGRKTDRNDVSFPDDRYVSGEHLLLDVDLEYLKVKDLNSTNGTFVNGERIEAGEWVDLTDGSEVKLGQTLITARRTAPPMEAVSMDEGKESVPAEGESAEIQPEEKAVKEPSSLSEPTECEGLEETDETLQD